VRQVIAGLAENGVKHIAMRCAGFDKVDLDAAATAGITVSRVPSYSPVSIAEHAVALLMTLNRKLHRVANRIREGNFTLSGLQGYEVRGGTALAGFPVSDPTTPILRLYAVSLI
jgi:D-lactate dehydrogenase